MINTLPAREQESSFTLARCDQPAPAEFSLKTFLRTAFIRLEDLGFGIEIQIGPDDER